MRKLVLVGLVIWLVVSGTALAEGWGNVQGKFVLGGTVPALEPIKVDADPAVCGKKVPLVKEDLVVGKDGAIANIVVSLQVNKGSAKPKVHPDYAQLIKADIVMDNNNCRFEPRIAVVRIGQKLVLANTDAVGHNVKGDLLANAAFNDLVPSGGKLIKTLQQEERYPMPCSCSIHRWMKGFIVVRDDPYAAVSSTKGDFAIKNVPAGKWTFRVWQESTGVVEDVTFGGKATKWTKGLVELTIEDGKTSDLGTIKISPKEFKK